MLHSFFFPHTSIFTESRFIMSTQFKATRMPTLKSLTLDLLHQNTAASCEHVSLVCYQLKLLVIFKL